MVIDEIKKEYKKRLKAEHDAIFGNAKKAYDERVKEIDAEYKANLGIVAEPQKEKVKKPNAFKRVLGIFKKKEKKVAQSVEVKVEPVVLAQPQVVATPINHEETITRPTIELAQPVRVEGGK